MPIDPEQNPFKPVKRPVNESNSGNASDESIGIAHTNPLHKKALLEATGDENLEVLTQRLIEEQERRQRQGLLNRLKKIFSRNKSKQ